MDPEGVAAQQGARRDAHRGAARVIVGQRIGDWRARSQLR